LRRNTGDIEVNWEAIGAIGEVAGAIGVIATLLYLAAQIRQNTRAMSGATQDAITERKQYELRWSSDIGVAWRKSVAEPENLTEEENWQMTEWMTASFIARQNEYFQFKQGLLDQEGWDASKKIIRMCLGSRWSLNWWKEWSPTGYTESFIALVEEVLAESEVDYLSVIEGVERGRV